MAELHPLAGTLPTPDMLVNVPRLITAYYTERPDPARPGEKVHFGTSGHRGSALERSFNEAHILAITQAICLYRKKKAIDGPLFLGIDSHALSEPARASALEVLAGNGVTTILDIKDRYIATPVISHAILSYNRNREHAFADGIVITPSHNPPEDGGIKYNPPGGGPADVDATSWIERTANDFLTNHLRGVHRLALSRALGHAFVHRAELIEAYAADLGNVIDMEMIAASDVKLGIDPLGGASTDLWPVIVEQFNLRAEIVKTGIDPTFRFIPLDWDGKIRMDCSSPYAMKGFVALKEDYDVAFANDTDADRHGIVCRSAGLIEPNRFLTLAIDYLLRERGQWTANVPAGMIGKTVVSSGQIDRVTAKNKRKLYETPVGFKWFADGLLKTSLLFGGEESAGASFLRKDGHVWTTDKDGMIMGLLAAEMTAREGRDPGELYGSLSEEIGPSFYARIDRPADAALRARIKGLDPDQIHLKDIAGDAVEKAFTKAPGNNEPIDGIKVTAKNGWFAVRPSGTEDVYKIYAESFVSAEHLSRLQASAEAMLQPFLARENAA